MIEQKKNDWLATLFFSPDKTPRDLAKLGITTDNSSIHDRDYYKGIDVIQDTFKTESGKFDEAKFNRFYDEVVKIYNDADNDESIKNILESEVLYDPYDYFAPIGANLKDLTPSIGLDKNPERVGKGIINIRQTTDPTMSIREVAQTNKVFNYETGKFEDWTPNDKGGFKGLFRPTLVLAQWDEDGTHVIDGITVSHKKGDLKFNESGDPFYETLGGRDLAGKDVLHLSDTLTVDGSKWNKIDFFDSDGLDKSVSGTLFKAVAKVAPMFIPYVGQWYGFFGASAQLGKLLPVLYKAVNGIASGDISDKKSTEIANNIQGWFSKFDSSTSDKNRNSFWNIENLGNIITDSSAQLFQQRFIFNLPKWLNSSKQLSDKSLNLSKNLSLLYMAGTSSVDSYDAFKEAGASDRVAGLGILATSAAMYGLMNTNYFRDWFFKGTELDRSKIKNAIKGSAKEIVEKIAPPIEQASSKEKAKWVVKAQNFIIDKFKNLSTNELFSDSLKEGTEEVMEEISSDFVKASFKALNELDLIDKNVNYNFGITPKDMFSRYVTSFVGGSIGGAVFHLQGKFESKFNNKIDESIEKGGDDLRGIIYLINSGKKDDLLSELEKWHKRGKLASTNLSGTETETIKDGNTYSIQYKTANKGESQNDLVYQQLVNYINRIDDLLKEENLDYSEEELQYITSIAKEQGVSVETIKNNINVLKRSNRLFNIKEQIIESGLYNQLFNDWQKLSEEIIKTKVSLEKMLAPSETESKTSKDFDDKEEALKNNSEYKQLKRKLDDLRKQRDEILKGEKNDFYTSQLLFAASPQLVEKFISGFGIRNYTKYYHNKNYDELSEEEKKVINTEYEEFSKFDEKENVIKAHKIFFELNELLTDKIKETSDKIKNNDLFISGTTEYKYVKDYLTKQLNDKLEELNSLDETDSEYNNKSQALNIEIENINNQINDLNNLKFERLLPLLNEKGREILKRNWDNVTDISDYANSYIEYLKYIINNNLYLDLIDSDLLKIFQSYLNQTNLNKDEVLESKIISVLNNHNIQLIDDSLNGFIKGISNIVNNTDHGNINDILSEYNILKSQYEDLFSTYHVVFDDIVNEIIGNIGNYKFIDYINQIKNLKSQITVSPIYDLLNYISTLSGQENNELLDIIKYQGIELLNTKNIEEFIIKNSNALNQIKELIKMIDALHAIIDASTTNGLNSKINDLRESLDKTLLPILNDEKYLSIINDLDKIKAQLSAIVELSERNQSLKLQEQKNISNNIHKKFLSFLLSNPVKEMFKSMNLDIDSIIDKLELLQIDLNNPKEVEIKLIEFESELFKLINTSNISNKYLAEKLISLFNSEDLIKGIPTEFTKDENLELSDFDKLIYLTTILSTPSINFYKDYLNIIKNNEFDKAPIFSQEYCIRIAYSKILNGDLYNQILYNIKSLAQQNNDEYIQTKSVLNFLYVIYGGAGTGKTTVVANIIKQLFPKTTIITSAPTDIQTERLSKNINHDGNKLSKDKLIEKILGRSIESDDIIQLKETVTLNPNVKVKTDNLFGDGEYKLLIIDEISWYNRIELELINKWAIKNNVNVICLGDYRQNSAKLIYNNKEYDCGIEDTFVTKSPNLTSPLRPDNIAKSYNYNQLLTILNFIYNKYYENPDLRPSELSELLDSYLSLNKLEFKYFETDNSFGGEKIVFRNEINKYIEKFKKLSSSVAIIADTPEKYNSVSGVKCLSLDSVQGDEYDYIIIDKSFKNYDSFHKLKDLYTLTQRSKKGTIILNKNIGNNITSKLDQNLNGNIELSEKQIKEFKDWRISILNDLPKNNILWEVKKDNDTIYENEKNNTDIKDSKIISDKDNESESVNDSEQKSSTDEIITDRIYDKDISEEEINPNDFNIDSDDEFVNNETEEESDIIESQKSNDKESEEVSTLIIKSDERETNINDSQPTITSKSENDLISKAEDYISFIKNDYKTFLNSRDFNIRKYTEIREDSKIYKLTNLLRAYFVKGYYKNETESEKSKHQFALSRLSEILNSFIDPTNRSLHNKIRKLFESNFEFEVIPYNNKGLLIAKIYINDKTIDIPLLITDPIIGIYNSDISVSSSFKFKMSKVEETDVTRFEESEINPFEMFSCSEPIILGADNEDLLDYTNKQKEFIKRNNGNTFLLITDDPFIDNDEFEWFLEPTLDTDSNLFSYTTQFNPSISLIGINWTLTFKEILDLSKTNLPQSNTLQNQVKFNTTDFIYSTRSGQILGLAYQVIPDKINKAIKSYFDSRQKFNPYVQINDEIFDNYESTIEYLNTVSKDKLSIRFGYFNAEKQKFVSEKGTYSINRVFYNIKTKQLLINELELEKINDLCVQYFKQGIYCHDIWVDTITGVWRTSNKYTRKYVTNATELYGCDYKIDGSKITPTKTDLNIEQTIINKINNRLKELGYNQTITNLDQLQSVINTINKNIVDSTTSIEFNILEIDNEYNIKQSHIFDPKHLIKNKLNVDYDSIVINDDFDSIFTPFFVSLQDKITYYVFETKNNSFNIREYSLYNEYNEFKSNVSKYINNQTYKYIFSLLLDIDIDLDSVNEFWNLVKNNPEYTELLDIINKYLIEKLSKYEC